MTGGGTVADGEGNLYAITGGSGHVGDDNAIAAKEAVDV